MMPDCRRISGRMFRSPEAAYAALPFLWGCVGAMPSIEWMTRIYGVELFLSGRLLRVAEVYSGTIRQSSDGRGEM
jgi:hypothetical protein